MTGTGVGLNTNSLKQIFGFGPSFRDGKRDRELATRLVDQHITLLLNYSKKLFQGVCTCGWTSTICSFEEADLMRAMHAHAVVTFTNYQ